MAWTTPRTWVAEEVVAAGTLNTFIRDNQNFLGTHGHSGAAGDGATAIGSLSKIVWANAAGDPGAVGTLQRNGTTLKWHNGGSVVDLGGVAAAATASLRTLGTANGTQGAPGTHSHSASYAYFATGSASGSANRSGVPSNSLTEVVAIATNAGSAFRGWLVHGTVTGSIASGSIQYNINVDINGTGYGSSAVVTGSSTHVFAGTMYNNPATGGGTMKIVGKALSGNGNIHYSAKIAYYEIGGSFA